MHQLLRILFLVVATPAFGASGSSRLSLTSLNVEGYEALEKRVSFWDIGVSQINDEAGTRCEMLEPQPKTKAAKQKWAPMDFYTQILDADEQKTKAAESKLGEADIFFSGDDGNRNGRKDSYKWTSVVDATFKGSLSFTEPKKGKDWFQFKVAFTRGKVAYGGLIRAVTWLSEGKCTGALFTCTKPIAEKDGTTSCAPENWNKQILKVIAEADVSGFLSDQLYGVKDEAKKNDVSAVHFLYQDWDTKGSPVGTSYRSKVASK